MNRDQNCFKWIYQLKYHVTCSHTHIISTSLETEIIKTYPLLSINTLFTLFTESSTAKEQIGSIFRDK